MASSTIALPILLSFLLPVFTQEIGCFVEGTCVGGIVIDIEPDINYSNDCLVLCKDDTECTHFTHQTTTTFCFKFNGCPDLSAEACPDCLSGHVNCSTNRCFLDGRCEGVGVGFSVELSKEACRDTCLGNGDCNYFTYNEADNSCLLTRNCSVDLSCGTCKYGERNCEAGGLSKILIISGWTDNGATTDVEVINMNSITQDCAKPANYPMPTDGPRAARIAGSIMSCGGSYSNSCYTFNSTDNTWLQATPMTESRIYFAATMINRGADWWITGGRNGSQLYFDATEVFKDGEFLVGLDLPEPMLGHCLVTINATHVFLAGGVLGLTGQSSNHAYIVNLEPDHSWQGIPDMTTAREAHSCNLIHTEEFGDEVVVVGGPSPTTEIYSLSTSSWRGGPSLNETVRYHATVPYKDSFLILGGYYAGIPTGHIYFFNTTTWSWVKEGQTLMTPRTNFASIMLKDDEVQC